MSGLSKIAFIGLGQMGLPMAHRLVSSGWSVAGFDPSIEARERLSSIGGVACDSAVEATSEAEFIITMLPNGNIVQQALLTDRQVLAGSASDAIIIEMSSSAPYQTKQLVSKLPSHLRLVDAPVSGGVKRATEGTLTVMAGGCEADVARVEPILQPIAAKVFRCGPVGAGHATKAINNFVSGAGVIAAIEAVILAQSFGLDPSVLTDVLNASSGKSNATEIKMKQFMLSGTFASGFAAGLMAKDIGIAADLSAELGLDQPVLKQTSDIWKAAAAQLGGSSDHTRMFEYLASVEKAQGKQNA